ncbi:MAG TPA: hypothetical protein P5096_01205 [Patescibacteria group bacterium]|nr:hypothetical protein [Patescibacteria group bacterium]
MTKIAVITLKRPDEPKNETNKKIIESIDSTFNPIGSGGYAVKYDGEKKRFIFIQCDCAPAKRFVAYLKESAIECQFEILGEIALALAKSDVPFSVDTKEVEVEFAS